MGQSCAGVAAWVTMQSAEGKSGASDVRDRGIGIVLPGCIGAGRGGGLFGVLLPPLLPLPGGGAGAVLRVAAGRGGCAGRCAGGRG